MMDDTTKWKALWGDRAAQEECTRAGVALSCHVCGGECDAVEQSGFGSVIVCGDCGCPGGQHVFFPSTHEALKAHNTRAPLPGENEHFHLPDWYIKSHPEMFGQAPEEPNGALTISELTGMLGKPVWLDTGEILCQEQICGCWEILDRVELDYDIFWFTRRKGPFYAHNYGITWLAYRKPPMEEGHAT